MFKIRIVFIKCKFQPLASCYLEQTEYIQLLTGNILIENSISTNMIRKNKGEGRVPI